jgi:hypothetical protein
MDATASLRLPQVAFDVYPTPTVALLATGQAGHRTRRPCDQVSS